RADLLQADPRKADLTLRHLLTMESGMLWADLETYPYSDPRNDLVRMFNSADPIGFILSRDLYAPPGEDFEYCNANTNLLGDIVGRATGQRLDDYSREHLFDPLGISEYEWQMISEDVVFASGDLRLRPRDMAKVGELFLRKGVWRGTQVVSRRWVEDATARHAVPDGPHAWADGYGFGWWHWDIPVDGVTYAVYMASGWGGQWIFVIPAKDMVFVTTAGNYERDAPMDAYRMLAEYLLRS
ncbi:MAG: serine hydrolase, partial [Gemmatimonadota bacterium]